MDMNDDFVDWRWIGVRPIVNGGYEDVGMVMGMMGRCVQGFMDDENEWKGVYRRVGDGTNVEGTQA